MDQGQEATPDQLSSLQSMTMRAFNRLHTNNLEKTDISLKNNANEINAFVPTLQNPFPKELLIKNEINDIIKEIKKHAVGSINNDKLMEETLKKYQDQIDKVDPSKLNDLKAELVEIHQSVSSSQVTAVKDAIKDMLKEGKAFFEIGHAGKANEIKQALLNTPLLERGTVISHAGLSNDVQKALARHRIGVFKEAPMINGIIDTDKAANIYKTLKTQFSNKPNPVNRNKNAPKSTG